MTFLLNSKFEYSKNSSLYDHLLTLQQQKDALTNQFKIKPIDSHSDINYPPYSNQIQNSSNINQAFNFEHNLFSSQIWAEDPLNAGYDETQLKSSFNSGGLHKKKEPRLKDELLIALNEAKGIINLGNTCYMNSILQILIHCLPFMSEFCSSNISLIQSQNLAYSFLLLIQNIIRSPQYEDNEIIQFYNCFLAFNPSFKETTQQDSSHFLLVFLQKLSSELNEVSNPVQNKTINSISDKREMYSRIISYCKSKEQSLVTRVFVWNLLTTYTCQSCSNALYSFNQIIDLPLPLDAFENNSNAFFLIRDYFCKEQFNELKGNCLHCQQMYYFKQKNTICSLPLVLILSFQRGNLGEKNAKKVFLEENIDLKAFVDEELFDFKTNTKYALFATLHHEGEINKGHYFSVIKIKDQWYQFNDSKVTLCLNLMSQADTAISLYYIRTDAISLYSGRINY